MPTSNSAGAEVFISYAQDEDRVPALALVDRLEASGASVWIAERRIEGAQNYADEIVAAIDTCTVLIVLCSHASMASRHVAVELGIAFEAGRPRLPLMLDQTPFPGQVRYFLADSNRIDVAGDIDEWYPNVVRALHGLGVRCSESPTFDGSYRTADTPSGFFRTPGDIHAHIDGGRNVDDIVALLQDLGQSSDEYARFPGKFNRISRFAGGPQRDDKAFAETYRYHTPGSAQKEDFDSFSTIWLGSGGDIDGDAVPALQRILEVIRDQPNAVVELERVIGILDTNGNWREADPPRIADPRTLEGPEFRDRPRLTTSTIEIHHSVDIPKRAGESAEEPGLSVDQLPTWPHLGGWFLFDKGDRWSYRSSEFVGQNGEYHYAASAGQRRLSDHLEQFGEPYELHTLVEQVLGIWRGGSRPRDDRFSLPALGAWELECPADGHVWVIAANFYGDRSPDVKRAMLENLQENVTYTYFLRTHADLLRLGLLAEDLERALVADGSTVDKAHRTVTEQIRCVLLAPDLAVDDARLTRLLAHDYFLCPLDPDRGGFRLGSSGLSGERVDEDDLAYMYEALSPLLEAKIHGLFFSSRESWQPQLSNQTVVCTDLEDSAVDQGEQPWLKMLAAYDRVVAREISTFGKKCFVVRPVRNGYLLIFEQASEAAEWSRRLQFGVRRHNEKLGKGYAHSLAIPEQNIALGYGTVSRVLRAHGHDYIGATIDDCIETVERLQGGVIAMSRSFAAQFESHVGRKEFEASTSESAGPDLRGLTLLDL